MHLSISLKPNKHKKLRQNILKHSYDFDVALQHKIEHENDLIYTQSTTGHFASNNKSKQQLSSNQTEINNMNDIIYDDIGYIESGNIYWIY